VYRCPLCATPLVAELRRAICSNGHSFDRSREGYINLLVRQRGHRSPGDPLEMVRARRAFLDAGYFAPLRNALLGRVSPGSVLDIGCGEGYYTRSLRSSPRRWVGAVDISKDAVRLAARRSKDVHYAVANAFDLPVLDASIDNAVIVFGPNPATEILRVLSPSGQVVVVGPGPGHLFQLKERILAHAVLHPMRVPMGRDPHLEVVEALRLSYEVTVGQPHLDALVEMTPYRWKLNDRRPLAHVDELSVTADFLVGVLRLAKAS
jgi:23S rRNA (guanine745-N1)-methyltransferase